MWNVCSSDTAVSVQFRCGQGLHHALFHACSSGKDSWCIYDLRFTIKVENTSQQVATFRDVEEKKAALLVIMHVTLAVSQQPVLCRHCEKLKAPGKFWRCTMTVLYIFIESSSQAGRAVQEENVTAAKGLWVCDDSLCHGISEMAVGLQSACRRIMSCFMMGELMGRCEERGNQPTAVGGEERAGNVLYQNQGEASCGSRKAKGWKPD